MSYETQRFSSWDITLPRADIECRRAGHIFASGWHIGYVWGSEAGEEYVEYLAQHRMTGDTHVRIWASGRADSFPAPASWVPLPPNGTAADEERVIRVHAERNRAMYDELRARGLLPPVGENLPALDINEYLRSGGRADMADGEQRRA